MRLRAALIVSLSANLALAAVLFYWLRQYEREDWRAAARTPVVAPPANLIKTNVVVRRLHFRWDDVESEDYPTYIKNLREIGCPEPTIRDIIVAEVNQLFAKRQATEVLAPEHQWWRSDPDPDVEQAAAEKLQALETERHELLTSLLGPGWETGADRVQVD